NPEPHNNRRTRNEHTNPTLNLHEMDFSSYASPKTTTRMIRNQLDLVPLEAGKHIGFSAPVG
ncbi:hypothetical protein, partial [Glaciihabitans sp. dw_435]|uniref:hypothetical protein n=1 Tax=Glaciihabitans sp. dw_435 TaxID=2720081 RepID=UPI001BD35888